MFAGERQGANIGLRAGQVKAKARSSMAARGIQLGEGNAAEVIASTDLMKEVDMLTVNANTVRAAEAARTQSVNYSNAALLEGVSASNLMTSADSISPFMGAYSSMLGSATSLANAWYQDRKLSAIAGRLGLEQ
jgi:inorganic triphosphatase YgiF